MLGWKCACMCVRRTYISVVVCPCASTKDTPVVTVLAEGVYVRRQNIYLTKWVGRTKCVCVGRVFIGAMVLCICRQSVHLL